MIKKYSKLLFLTLLTFFLSITIVSAKEVNLTELTQLVEQYREKSDNNELIDDYVFIVGKYVFTSNYRLTLSEVMIGGNSVGMNTLDKTWMYRVDRLYDGFTPIGWDIENIATEIGNIDPLEIYDIEYIDMVPILSIGADDLETVKDQATTDLDNYVDSLTGEYTGENKDELDAAIEAGKSAIEEATTPEEVQEALDNAKEAIDNVKTDEEVLNDAKEEAKNSLTEYVEELLPDYEVNGDELQEILDEAVGQIDEATTPEEVQDIVDAAKEAMSEVESDADIAARELLDAQNDAKSKLVDAANAAIETHKESMDAIGDIVEEALADIEEATTPEEVQEALDKAKDALEQLPSDEEALKAKKAEAEQEIIDHANELLPNHQKSSDQLEAAILAAAENIEKAQNGAEVEKAVEDAKAAMDAIPSDEEIAAQELLDAQNNAVGELVDMANSAREEHKFSDDAIEDALTDALDAVQAATTPDEVQEAIEAAKEAFDAIPSDAEVLKEAKDEASQEVVDYASSLIPDHQKNSDQLDAALVDAIDSIAEATTPEEVEKALEDAKAAMDAIEDDATVAAKELLAAQNAATGELVDMANSAREEHKFSDDAIEKALTDALDAVQDATTPDEVREAIEAAQEAFDAIPSDAEVLNTAKSEAAKEAAEYASSLLPNHQKSETELENALIEAVDSINAATTPEEAEKALEDAKAAMDAIPTDEQVAAKELAEAKSSATDELVDMANDANADRTYNSDAVTEALRNALADVDAATTPEEVKEAVDAAREAFDAIPTDAEVLKEAKSTALEEITDYASSLIPDHQKNSDQLDEALMDALDAIDAATTPDEVQEAVDAAKEVMDAIEDDATVAAKELLAAQNDATDKLVEMAGAALANRTYSTDAVDKALTDALAAVNAATTPDEVQKAVDAAKEAFDAIPTDAQVLNKAQNDAIETLTEAINDALATHKESSDAIEDIMGQAYDDIYAAETPDEVQEILDKVQEDLEKLPSDEEVIAKKLLDAQNAAMSELANMASAANEEHKFSADAVEKALTDALDAVNAATTPDEVQKAIEAAQEAFDAIPTDAKVLKDAKDEALNDLEDYFNNLINTDHKKSEDELLTLFVDGVDDIDAATTPDGVKKALDDAKAAMDAIPNDEQVAAKELADAKESATSELINIANNAKKTNTESSDEIDKIFTDALADIDEATTPEEVEEALENAKKELANLPSDEELRIEARNNAQSEFLEYVNDIDSQYPDYFDVIQEVMLEEIDNIFAAETVDDVEKALEDAKARLDNIESIYEDKLKALKASKTNELMQKVNDKISSGDYELSSSEITETFENGLADMDNANLLKDVEDIFDRVSAELDSIPTDEEVIENARDEAFNEVLDYATDLLDTHSRNQDEIDGILGEFVSSYKEPSTLEEIADLVKEFKSRLDAVEDDATVEANELLAAKNDAEAKLLEFLNSVNNDCTEKNAELLEEFQNGLAAIQAATTLDEVQDALKNAKAAMDAIPTDAELLNEAIANAQDDILAYAGNLEQTTHTVNSEQIQEKMIEYFMSVQSAKSLTEVQEIVTEAKQALDAVESDEIVWNKQLEQAKKAAVTELKSTAETLKADRQESLSEVENQITLGETNINDVTLTNVTKEGIKEALEAVKNAKEAAINAIKEIKTDKQLFDEAKNAAEREILDYVEELQATTHTKTQDLVMNALIEEGGYWEYLQEAKTRDEIQSRKEEIKENLNAVMNDTQYDALQQQITSKKNELQQYVDAIDADYVPSDIEDVISAQNALMEVVLSNEDLESAFEAAKDAVDEAVRENILELLDTVYNEGNEYSYKEEDVPKVIPTTIYTEKRANITEAETVDEMIQYFEEAIEARLTKNENDLNKAKEEARKTLNNYKGGAENYNNAGSVDAYNDIIEQFNASLESATTPTDVVASLVVAQNAIDKLENNEAYDARILSETKDNNKNAIDSYVNELKEDASYTEDRESALTKAIQTAKDAIDEAESVEEANSLLEEAKTTLSGLQTDEQFYAEELAEAIKTADADLETYKGGAENYDNEESKTAYEAAIQAYEDVKKTATRASEIEEALQTAKETIDGLADNAKHLQNVKDKNKAAIDAYLEEKDSTENYTGENKTQLDNLVDTAKSNIDAAESPEEADRLLEEVKQEIDKVPTDAEVTAQKLKEAKEQAIKDFDQFIEELTEEFTENPIDDIIEQQKDNINGVGTIDEVEPALEAAKKAINDVDSDDELDAAREKVKSAINKYMIDNISTIRDVEKIGQYGMSNVASIETSFEEKLEDLHSVAEIEAVPGEDNIKVKEAVLAQMKKDFKEYLEDVRKNGYNNDVLEDTAYNNAKEAIESATEIQQIIEAWNKALTNDITDFETYRENKVNILWADVFGTLYESYVGPKEEERYSDVSELSDLIDSIQNDSETVTNKTDLEEYLATKEAAVIKAVKDYTISLLDDIKAAGFDAEDGKYLLESDYNEGKSNIRKQTTLENIISAYNAVLEKRIAIISTQEGFESELDKLGAGKKTIVVSSDIELTKDLVIPTGADLTIEARTNITTSNTIKVEDGASLTINSTDSHSFTSSSDNLFTVEKNAKLVINGGTYKTEAHKKAAIVNNGTVEIKNGIIKNDSETDYYVLENHGNMTISNGVTVTSTEVNGASNASLIINSETEGVTPTLTIDGGSFSGGLQTIKNETGCKLVVNGGTFTNGYSSLSAVIMNWGETTINNGTFSITGEVTSIIQNINNPSKESSKGNLVINGGTFNVEVGKYVVRGSIDSSYNQGTVTINDAAVKVGEGSWVNAEQYPNATYPGKE